MKKILFLSLLLTVSLFSCKNDGWDDLTVQDKLDGKWVVTSSVVFGGTFPGDGSYVEFQSCSTDTCIGMDFDQSDTTNGSFTWWLESADTKLGINDTTNDGGAYGGLYDIDELTRTTLEISTESVFGPVSFTATKEE